MSALKNIAYNMQRFNELNKEHYPVVITALNDHDRIKSKLLLMLQSKLEYYSIESLQAESKLIPEKVNKEEVFKETEELINHIIALVEGL